ncbi:MAG: 50S ribosomal protein L11 [Candidatus Aenigmarchaeota archaeon]|nr:50S ribosomal protein L11 [Candidatus Aenigmarchaeota archaeon]
MGKKETVEALVQGGKASAAPPLGPALGPTGVNIGEVISAINEKTAAFSGMEVPVKIHVDTETRKFTITVGTPPVTSMLKKEMNVQKLAKVLEGGERQLPGSIPFEKIVTIAKSKDSLGGSMKSRVKQVLGTCVSCGVLVDGKNPKDVQKEVDGGMHDKMLV